MFFYPFTIFIFFYLRIKKCTETIFIDLNVIFLKKNYIKYCLIKFVSFFRYLYYQTYILCFFTNFLCIFYKDYMNYSKFHFDNV